MIELKTYMCAVDAINVLMYFVFVTLLIQLLAKHSPTALPCKQFINDLSVHKSLALQLYFHCSILGLKQTI